MVFIVGVWLVRSITGPLEAAVKIADGVAAGDLTQRIDVQSKDETGPPATCEYWHRRRCARQKVCPE